MLDLDAPLDLIPSVVAVPREGILGFGDEQPLSVVVAEGLLGEAGYRAESADGYLVDRHRSPSQTRESL